LVTFDHLGLVPAAALLVFAVSDLDPSRLSGLFHRDRQVQHAVAVVGADVLGVDVVAEDEVAGEATLRSFGRQDLVAFAEHGLPGGLYGQGIAFDCQLGGVGVDAGQVQCHVVAVGGAPGVHRHRRQGACAGHQLAGQPVQVPEGIPLRDDSSLRWPPATAARVRFDVAARVWVQTACYSFQAFFRRLC
jgi:hypothetical protein